MKKLLFFCVFLLDETTTAFSRVVNIFKSLVEKSYDFTIYFISIPNLTEGIT